MIGKMLAGAAVALFTLSAGAESGTQTSDATRTQGHQRRTPSFDQVVIPTGGFPADLQNVQAAVDLGGTVLLKAKNSAGLPTAFNFGAPPPDEGAGYQVALQGDVQLFGEAVGSARTTIQGGYRSVLVGVTGWQQGYSPVPGRVRIQGIDFEGPEQAAIDVYQAADVEIADIGISNVVMTGGIATGINIFGGGEERRVTGKVVIRDNVIRYRGEESAFSSAIVLDDLSADVNILRNVIETTQDVGAILVVRQVEGRVRIAYNLVVPDRDAPGLGAGIYIFANDLWNDIRTSRPRYEIVDNCVVTEAYGIGLVGDRGSIDAPIIKRNNITARGLFDWEEGIFFGGNVSGAIVSDNRIDGAGAYGIDVFAFEPGQVADSNVFKGNDLSHFDAGIADVFLDAYTTNNRVVVDRSDTVLDLGSGNRVIRH